MILGEYDTRSNPDCDADMCADKVQVIKIDKSFAPPTFRIRKLLDDILIIKLQKPAKLTGWNETFCSLNIEINYE